MPLFYSKVNFRKFFNFDFLVTSGQLFIVFEHYYALFYRPYITALRIV
uniref:Uncharacterized protein n=1 Tax=Anguilla anguilla TaxID=7936 RepID=A0A0E9WL56_ANGAN